MSLFLNLFIVLWHLLVLMVAALNLHTLDHILHKLVSKKKKKHLVRLFMLLLSKYKWIWFLPTNVCILLLSCNVKKSKTTALCIYEKNRDNCFVLWYRELNYMYKNIIYAVKIFCQSISLYVKKKAIYIALFITFVQQKGWDTCSDHTI